jgi:hypothetical protein
MIGDGDVGESDPLENHRPLAGLRKRQNGLRAYRGVSARERDRSTQQPYSKHEAISFASTGRAAARLVRNVLRERKIKFSHR